MMVSTKGRYALRVMIDLAEHQSEGYVPLISHAQSETPNTLACSSSKNMPTWKP